MRSFKIPDAIQKRITEALNKIGELNNNSIA